MLRCFPRVDAADLRSVRRGCLCEDVCFGHDSRGEVPRGALDSKDGSVHCSGVMMGRGVKVLFGITVSSRNMDGTYQSFDSTPRKWKAASDR